MLNFEMIVLENKLVPKFIFHLLQVALTDHLSLSDYVLFSSLVYKL